MNHNHIPTEQEERVAAETNAAFSKQMQQFKDVCGVIHDLENNLTTIGNEHLDKNYPRQDMSIVVESFEIKMSRAISERSSLAQSQSRGIRV